MKKLLLLVSPLIFLVACGGGGGGDTTPQNDITGVWELKELMVNGENLDLSVLVEALYYYHPDGTYEAIAYTTDGTPISARGTYSYSNGKMELKYVDLTNGKYDMTSNTFSWISNDEITSSNNGTYCEQFTGSARFVKTTNSLGEAPNKTAIGKWNITEANHNGVDNLADYIYDHLYIHPDGTWEEEQMTLTGELQELSGTWLVSSDQTTFTMIDNNIGIPVSANIDKWEIDKVEMSSPDVLGTGPYSLKMERIACEEL